MNFTNDDFSNFKREMKNALQEICAKYQVKVKSMQISYGQVDFDLKISFEKDEADLNTERIQFETECEYYGFTPDDYLRIFNHKGKEYELAGFVRSARKYNCLVRDIISGDEIRINNRYLRQLFDQELQAYADSNHEEQRSKNSQEEKDWTVDNILSDEELSILSIKIAKSKRTEKDWSIIKELLKGKEVLTFTANSYVPWISSIQGVAQEENALLVYTNKAELLKHLKDLAISGDIHKDVILCSCTFEDVLQISNDNNIMVLFDMTGDKSKKYLCYNPDKNELKVCYLA